MKIQQNGIEEEYRERIANLESAVSKVERLLYVLHTTLYGTEQLKSVRIAKFLRVLKKAKWRFPIMVYRKIRHGVPFAESFFAEEKRILYALSLEIFCTGCRGELGIQDFGRRLSRMNPRGVFILGSRMMGWFETFKQRHHHIAEYLVSQGFVVVCAMNPQHKDDVTHGMRQIDERMYLANFDVREFRDMVLAEIVTNTSCKVFYHIVGTEPGTTVADIARLKEFGITLYYEYFDEISKEIFSSLSQMQIDRHAALIADPDVLVCTTAQKLYDNVVRARKCEKNLFLSRNAVTLEDWNYDSNRDGVPPEIEKIVSLGKPIIGFYGSFAPWLDYAALRNLAERRPSYQIVMIGYDYEWGKGAFAASRIAELPNVHIIPAQKYRDLKKFSHWFDIGILPFRIYSLTETVSPVKIFEYMAQGKPVVAAALPECKLYKSVLTFATQEEFIRQTDRALALKSDPAYLASLHADAMENTWAARGAQVLEQLERRDAPEVPVRRPVLTIGIPLYNMEKYLGACLDSMLTKRLQTLEGRFEIIVVNDGSKDGSLSLARKYESEYPDIVRVIDKSNGGHGSCINASVAAARGTYFKLVDSDDWLDSMSLLLHLRFLEKTDADAVFCDYMQVYEDGQERPISYATRTDSGLGNADDRLLCFAKGLDFLSYIHMHALTYRTSVLKHHKITEGSFYVDQEYISFPLKHCRSIAYQAGISLYRYRLGREGQSVDAAVARRRIGQNLNVLKNVCALCDSLSPERKALRTYLQTLIYNQSYFYLTYSDDQDGFDFVYNWWRRQKTTRHPFTKKLLAAFTETPKGRDRKFNRTTHE